MLAQLERVLPHIAGGSEIAKKLTPHVRQQLLTAMSALKERAKTLVELADGANFIVAERPLSLDQKASALLSPQTREILAQLRYELRRVDPWTAETTERAIRDFAQRFGMKLGNIAQPLRAALTGRTTSPPIFEVLVVLGKDECLARIADQTPAPAVSR